MPGKEHQSSAHRIFEQMLERIRCGQWAVGQAIPPERALVNEFGVSRICLRESLSMLRAMGLLDTVQGRGSIVRKLDSRVVGQLAPLMLSMEGDQALAHIFEVRLALEARTAYIAAMRRTDEQAQQLIALAQQYTDELPRGLRKSVRIDLDFHMAIAEATGNPIFPLMLGSLSGFVEHGQLQAGEDDRRRWRASHAHEAIARAISHQDAQRASIEMESHLRSSADDILSRSIVAPASRAADDRDYTPQPSGEHAD